MVAKLKVNKSAKEEAFKDLVRAPRNVRPGKNGTICWIRVDSQTALASVRGLDGVDEDTIKIDEAYRDILQVEVGESYSFEIQAAELLGRIRWHWSATDPAVRMPARVAVISLILGAVGVGLGGLSIYFSN